MGLVNNEQVPLQLLHPLQFVIGAAEVDRAFQPLQALEAYLSVEAIEGSWCADPFHKLLTAHQVGLVAQGRILLC